MRIKDAPPGYAEYHQRVVDACCKLMGEIGRHFWDNECDYIDSFNEGIEPEEVAEIQREAL